MFAVVYSKPELVTAVMMFEESSTTGDTGTERSRVIVVPTLEAFVICRGFHIPPWARVSCEPLWPKMPSVNETDRVKSIQKRLPKSGPLIWGNTA